MKKSKKDKSAAQEADVPTRLKNINDLIIANKVGQVCTLIQELAEDIVNDKVDIDINGFEKLFVQVMPKLKWQKDVMKNQTKLSLLRSMAKAFQKLDDQDYAMKCYMKLVEKYMSTITCKNFNQHYWYIYQDFHDGWLSFSQSSDYSSVVKMVAERFNDEKLPKDNKLYDFVLEISAKIQRSKNHFLHALDYENARLMNISLNNKGIEKCDIFANIIQDSFEIFDYEYALQNCGTLIRGYEKVQAIQKKHLIENYIIALFYKAQCLTQLKRKDSMKAWSEFHAFVETNSNAKELIKSNNNCKKMLQVALQHLTPDQVPSIDAAIHEAKNLVRKQLHSKAYKVLEKVINNVNNISECSDQSAIKNYAEIHHLMALCLCRAGDHQQALKFWVENVLENINKVLVKTETVDLQELCYRICHCFSYHLKYFDEAYDVIVSNFEDPKQITNYFLLVDYIKLLIFKGKSSQAIEFMEQQRPDHNLSQIKDASFVHMWTGKFRKAIEIMDVNLLGKLKFADSFLGETESLELTYYFYALRKFKQFPKALKQFKNTHTEQHLSEAPIGAVSGSYCQLQCGDDTGIVTLIKDAFENANNGMLATLAYDMFECIDPSDPKKFLRWVQKDTRNNGKLIKHKEHIEHFHNSVRITLEVKKQLNIKVSESLFKEYTM